MKTMTEAMAKLKSEEFMNEMIEKIADRVLQKMDQRKIAELSLQQDMKNFYVTGTTKQKSQGFYQED